MRNTVKQSLNQRCGQNRSVMWFLIGIINMLLCTLGCICTRVIVILL